MKKNKTLKITGLFLIAFILGCASGGSNTGDPTQSQQQTDFSTPAPLYWTDDGGSGMSITILPPRGSGLTADQAYLPDLVANELLSNFRTYSDMTLFDRVNNQRQYEELLSGYYADDDPAGLDLGHLSSTDYMLLGTITRTSTGYALQLTVNKNSDKTTIATYSQTVSIAELDNFTGIRQASLDLLQKLGIQPTDRTRTELTRAAETNQVQAQTALAQGITAQRQGTEVAALSYYFQAAAFDPSLGEATSRVNIVSVNISSGNIGENVRNDIQWRNDWVAKLTATERDFYQLLNAEADPPYSLFYSTAIEQGNINYTAETVDMSIPINLHGRNVWFNSVERALQTVYKPVYDGLAATNRASTWGLNWPQQAVSNTNPFGFRKQYNFAIVFELVNQQSQVIGRQTVNLRPEYSFSASGDRVSMNYSENSFNTVTFNGVKANEITDNLTIRIATINGATPENARLQITAMDQNNWDVSKNTSYTISSGVDVYSGIRRDWHIDYEFSTDAQNLMRAMYGVITGYTSGNTNRNLVIPSTVWGEPVTSIGARAFESKQLTSITIPDSVIAIGESAFENNQLTSVTIPHNVITIGYQAFKNNPLAEVVIGNGVATIGESAFEAIPIYGVLRSVVIGNSVKTIGNYAFKNHQLTSVVIPDSVTYIGKGVFYTDHSLNGQTGYSNINPLVTVTIGANVSFPYFYFTGPLYNAPNNDPDAPFPSSLAIYYDRNGRKAGVYQCRNKIYNTWSFTAR